MKINKLAIVGLGSIGRRHLRLLSEMRPDIEITIVRSGKGGSCDEESLAERVVFSIEEAVSCGVQAAIVSSPASLHLEQSLKLAKAGVHLLIEKPLSTSVDNVSNLLDLIHKNEIVVAVGYVLRHEPGAIKFYDWLSNRLTGKILHASIECGSYLPTGGQIWIIEYQFQL